MLVRRVYELPSVPHQIIRTLNQKWMSWSLTFKVDIVHQDHNSIWFEALDKTHNFPFGLLLHMTVDCLLGCRNIGEVGRKDFSLIEVFYIIQELW